jgi:hypothetical protein
MEAIGLVALGLLGVLIVFQLALAAGAPWGSAAYGGVNPGVLKKGFRINSLVFGLVIYPLIALYVIDAADLAAVEWLPGSTAVVMWIETAFFGLGTVANIASRSPIERWWAPVSLVLCVCCAVLA